MLNIKTGVMLMMGAVCMVLNAEKAQAQFSLHSNGVTILCPDAAVGTTGTVGGKTYTKRTKDQITTGNATTTCTSGMTDMSSLFKSQDDFNEDISHWDVSNVTDMSGMFYDATAFNQNISGWCVSQINSEPSFFAVGSALVAARKPRWGICPSSH